MHCMQWRRTAHSTLKPVAIVLTDSGDCKKATGLATMREIMQKELQHPEAERLAVHVIGFGPQVDGNFIRDLAAIGGGSHFTCHAAIDMDRLKLVKAFTRIAARPADQVALVPK